jgi:hypothetical protein
MNTPISFSFRTEGVARALASLANHQHNIYLKADGTAILHTPRILALIQHATVSFTMPDNALVGINAAYLTSGTRHREVVRNVRIGDIDPDGWAYATLEYAYPSAREERIEIMYDTTGEGRIADSVDLIENRFSTREARPPYDWNYGDFDILQAADIMRAIHHEDSDAFMNQNGKSVIATIGEAVRPARHWEYSERNGPYGHVTLLLPRG